MSQAKVDRYKKNKKNRAKIMRREKIEVVVLKVVGVLAAAFIIGWAGVSAYNSYEASRPVVTTAIDTTAISDYLNGIVVE
ncbi:MAG: hypothetical protein ACK5ML_10565 [Lachnospiraceae bacterium]